MKKFLFFVLVLIGMVSCTSEQDEPNQYGFIGTYVSVNERIDDTLEIKANKTFIHHQIDVREGDITWGGIWSYDEKVDLIYLVYTKETVIDLEGNKSVEILSNDVCYAQPYNNFKGLKYKEYLDDDWDSYDWFVRK